MRFLFIILFWLSGGYAVDDHPFHVAISHVEWDGQQQRLKVSHKVFRDDMNNPLPNCDFIAGSEISSTAQVEYIKSYLDKNFIIKDDKGRMVPSEWFGYEFEDDLLWIYTVYPSIKRKPKNYTIVSTLLFETFGDQLNIVHFDTGSKTISSHFNADNKEPQTIPLHD